MMLILFLDTGLAQLTRNTFQKSASLENKDQMEVALITVL